MARENVSALGEFAIGVAREIRVAKEHGLDSVLIVKLLNLFEEHLGIESDL
mgnify:CR=1 FL=1